MKTKELLLLLILWSLCAGKSALAQEQDEQMLKTKFGLQGGPNFLSLNHIKSMDLATKNNTGFFVGAHYAIPSKRFGFRSEVLYSRQGYDYKTSTQTGNVMLDYLVLPQLTTLNLTRFFQFYAGGQVAFLLNAKVDSSANPSSVPNLEKAKDFFAKMNYGFVGGLEVRPFAGLLVGGRYNLFFDMLGNAKAPSPSYVPKYDGDLKNGLVQVYIGYQF